jgi:hypothetical protein
MVSRNLFAGAFASAITLLVATTMSIGPSQATTTTTTVITTTTSLGVEVVTDTTTTSSATVTSLFSVIPGEIFAGAQATLDLQLSLVGDVGIVFTGGSATLFFGDGGSALFNIGNSGGTFREFSATHAYSIPGDYSLSFTASANFDEIARENIATTDCFFDISPTCPSTVTTSFNVTHVTVKQVSVAGQASLIVDPTPLPAALPLFATGLGALGLLRWRRKRKQVA